MCPERLDQGETGLQPIQVLCRMALPSGRRNPGEVKQMGRPQLRNQPLRGAWDVQVEIVPGYPVRSIGVGAPGHRMNAKTIPDQRLHAMAPQKAGAAGGEDIGGHDVESSFSQLSIMTCN